MTKIYCQFAIGFILLMVGLVCQCRAQSLGFAVDSSGKISPSLMLPVFDLNEAFGFKVKSTIVAFGGSSVEGGQVTGGGAWVFDFPVAKGQDVSLKAFLGPSLSFEQGAPAKLGFVFGVRW